MHPAPVIKYEPEWIQIKSFRVSDDSDEYALDALLVHRSGEMMMVDDVASASSAQDNPNHLLAQVFIALLIRLCPPFFALGIDVTQSDRDLHRMSVSDGHWVQDWFTRRVHALLRSTYVVMSERHRPMPGYRRAARC